MQNSSAALEEKYSVPDPGRRAIPMLRPIVLIGFVTGQGGDAVQMMELAAGVQAQGRTVHIVLPDTPAARAFARRCRQANVSVECSPLITADESGNTRSGLRNIMKLLIRFRKSVIHFHTGDLVLPRKAILALKLMRLRDVVITVHHPADYLDPRSPRARFWAAAIRHSAIQVVCPSDHSYRIQRRLGVPASHLTVIRNGVNTAQYSHGNAAVVRTGVLSHLPEQAQLLLFTARMEAEKGAAVALAAFQRVAPEMENFHFVFVGWGSLHAELRAAVHPALRERVHFVGFQTNIADWLAAATLWLHASETENCSMALLEALAAGCPTIATMCPGNNELLVEGQNALTFSPGDIDTFALAMRRLLNDSQLRLSLSRAARQTADQFSLQNMVAGHMTHCY